MQFAVSEQLVYSLVKQFYRAYSLVVRRGIRIAEAGVRFPLGPPEKANLFAFVGNRTPEPCFFSRKNGRGGAQTFAYPKLFTGVKKPAFLV